MFIIWPYAIIHIIIWLDDNVFISMITFDVIIWLNGNIDVIIWLNGNIDVIIWLDENSEILIRLDDNILLNILDYHLAV
jgi:hypothetical protein